MTVLLTVATLFVAPATHPVCDQACAGRRHERRTVDYRLRHACNHRVVACIDRAARLHRVDRWMLRRRAYCESRLDPAASNGTHFGLFQFAWSTYNSTPYAGRGSIWSAKWNSLAAAWMQSVGRGNEWTCQ